MKDTSSSINTHTTEAGFQAWPLTPSLYLALFTSAPSASAALCSHSLGVLGLQPRGLPCARCCSTAGLTPSSELTKRSARMEDRKDSFFFFHTLTSSQVGCEIKNYLNTHLCVNTKTFSEGNWLRALSGTVFTQAWSQPIVHTREYKI